MSTKLTIDQLLAKQEAEQAEWSKQLDADHAECVEAFGDAQMSSDQVIEMCEDVFIVTCVQALKRMQDPKPGCNKFGYVR